jgi:hypothetical protein
VLYDYQGFMQRYGGVSRYFVELTRAMRLIGDFEPLIEIEVQVYGIHHCDGTWRTLTYSQKIAKRLRRLLRLVKR